MVSRHEPANRQVLLAFSLEHSYFENAIFSHKKARNLEFSSNSLNNLVLRIIDVVIK
jgi:hypothetical protein